MDELKIVKLAELRSRLSAIPVKLVLTFLFVAGVYWHFDFSKSLENIPTNLFLILVTYGIGSYFWFCVKLTRNWLVGIIVAIILIFVWQANLDKMGEAASTIIGMAICFGGPVIDLVTIIRYFLTKKAVFNGSGIYQDYDSDEETYGHDYQEAQDEPVRERQDAPSRFFNDCKDQNSIKRRYKDLCRVYHPDNGNGSAEIFNEITEEYHKLMEQF